MCIWWPKSALFLPAPTDLKFYSMQSTEEEFLPIENTLQMKWGTGTEKVKNFNSVLIS